jgi:hypothetical protein
MGPKSQVADSQPKRSNSQAEKGDLRKNMMIFNK